jgi:hypothetical protein
LNICGGIHALADKRLFILSPDIIVFKQYEWVTKFPRQTDRQDKASSQLEGHADRQLSPNLHARQAERFIVFLEKMWLYLQASI